MKRKKKVLLIATLVLSVLIGGIHLLRGNDRLGFEIYGAANVMSGESYALANIIDSLVQDLETVDNESADWMRQVFDSDLLTVRMSFGYEDLPLLEDVRLKWKARFEELYQETLSDEDFKDAFTNPEKVKEMTLLKDQLNFLMFTLIEFHDDYNEMPVWKRYFVSWRNERKILSEKVDILQSEEE